VNKDLLDRICLRPEEPLSVAVACIENSGGEIALVTDVVGRLVGTITDGDIRRGILRGHTLETPASEIMNGRPRFVDRNASPAEIGARLRQDKIAQMPIVDDAGRVVDVVYAKSLSGPDPSQHTVVIMAGGLGTRLRPITETIPKPMIEIGGRPILEAIIERFRLQGFRSIVLCVNHLAEVIIDHFGDGSRFDVEIDYVRETKRLGTAGALSLLKTPQRPVIVMNGDILTLINFNQLLAFHYENLAEATMGLNRFQYQLPYGVVEVDGSHIRSFAEKPVYDFFVNAGIYVISPEAVAMVPGDQYFDMPALFDRLAPERRAAFPIHEYWLDIGRQDDLEKAMSEFAASAAAIDQAR
jgi:dTDP-glucose pyrophosphorylase